MKKRPNFLFITTDQQRADHLGCYGNTVVRTPAIDSLAARGLSFDRFYVASPICMPNRIAILTGRMPTVNGSRHNGIPLPLDAVTFVDVLRAGGYHTALVGKSHAQNITGHELIQRDLFPSDNSLSPPPPELEDATRLRRIGTDYEQELMPLWHERPKRNAPKLPYYGYDYVRFANGHADHVQGHYTDWLNERAGGNGDHLRGPLNALPATELTAPQAWRTAIPEDWYPTTYIEEQTRAFIDLHTSERPSDPFFIHCSFTDPHHPFTPPGHYFDLYNPADIALPVSFHHRDNNEPVLLKRLRRDYELGQARNQGPLPFCVSEGDAQQIIALTYGMISMIDDAIAGLLAHLNARGLLEDTVVVFTSDHGDFMGDHGLMLKHGLHYEGVLRVPFIWADPTQTGSQRSSITASAVDISASVLARAGLAPNNGNQGLDVIGQTEKLIQSRRTGVLIEEDELGDHLGGESGLRTRSFISGDWRLTLWQGMEGSQLYNRRADPNELHNLANDDRFAAKKAEMTEAMLREMIRLNDTSPYATFVA